MTIRLTHLGTATVLLELGDLRLLTDPALDAAGGRYGFGFGTRSTKLAAPALPASGLGRIDAVLLSHDHHADNLDTAGRALLPQVGTVLTTASGAVRLGGNARGLRPWESAELGPLKVTATPARHGPPLSRAVVGDVVGFLLEGGPLTRGPLYISGDTVWFDGVAEVAKRYRVGTALLHMGGVRFPMLTGPLRYTMTGAEARLAAEALGAQTIVPIHYEGWSHFHEPRAEAAAALAPLGDRVRWVPMGQTIELEA